MRAGSVFHGQLGPSFGNWTRAEWYARDIIEDLNHFVNGWSEWTYTVNITVGTFPFCYLPLTGCPGERI